jgi:2-dehydro-3-deoxy-D-gluconate 5-dehydrogenase
MRVLDLFKLNGQTALVTGCRRGSGKAMAEGLAEAGAVIVGVKCDARARWRRSARGRARVRTVVPRLRWRFFRPPIDILINNAGSILREPAAEHPDEYWAKIIETNLSSQFVLTREFGRDMVVRRRGKIVFTASLLTFQGGITVPGYAASKGALGSLVKAFASEWAGQGVNVNAIAPGYIATDNTAALRADPVRNPAILSRIPAGRWGEPDDFKGVAVFLSSRASGYMSGEIVTVDGGWMGR